MSWFRRPNTGAFSSVYEWQGSNFSECGPAALAILASIDKDTKITRQQCRALQMSPSWWRAVDFLSPAHNLGVRLSLRSLSLQHTAGIYLSSYWGFGHWVVAWLDAEDNVQVLDPKRGSYVTDQAAFNAGLRSNTYLHSDINFK